MEPLSKKQRRALKALAHPLRPICYIGKNGLTQAAIDSIDVALEAHELVKVKFVDHKAERREISDRLAYLTESHLVGIVGHVATLYRRQRDPERRRIALREDSEDS